MRLRAADPGDADAIAAIYAPYVSGSTVSFETAAPSVDEMAARITGAGLHPWLVAEETGTILGYAYAAPFRARPAYRYTVETSVYLAESAQGQGLGRRLYAALLELLEEQGFAQAIAAITLPNPASVALHERLGFEPAGRYRDVGYKMGGWHSVGLWQRRLAPIANPPTEPKPVASCRSPD